MCYLFHSGRFLFIFVISESSVFKISLIIFDSFSFIPPLLFCFYFFKYFTYREFFSYLIILDSGLVGWLLCLSSVDPHLWMLIYFYDCYWIFIVDSYLIEPNLQGFWGHKWENFYSTEVLYSARPRVSTDLGPLNSLQWFYD